MKGNLLNLVSEAQVAFREMTSICDRALKSNPDWLEEERLKGAKRQGTSALDKLHHMLTAEDIGEKR